MSSSEGKPLAGKRREIGVLEAQIVEIELAMVPDAGQASEAHVEPVVHQADGGEVGVPEQRALETGLPEKVQEIGQGLVRDARVGEGRRASKACRAWAAAGVPGETRSQ